MKQLFLFILFFLAHQLTAQNSNINIGFELIKDNINGGNYLVTHGNINGYSLERTRFNYSIGVTAEVPIKGNFLLSSGVLYSNKDLNGKYNCASCSPYPQYSYEMLKQRYLSIPILLEYQLFSSKLKAELLTGFVNNFTLTNDFNDAKKYYLEGQVGVSIRYPISYSTNIQLSYSYRSAFSKIYNDREVNKDLSRNYTPNKLITHSFKIGFLHKL